MGSVLFELLGVKFLGLKTTEAVFLIGLDMLNFWILVLVDRLAAVNYGNAEFFMYLSLLYGF